MPIILIIFTMEIMQQMLITRLNRLLSGRYCYRRAVVVGAGSRRGIKFINKVAKNRRKAKTYNDKASINKRNSCSSLWQPLPNGCLSYILKVWDVLTVGVSKEYYLSSSRVILTRCSFYMDIKHFSFNSTDRPTCIFKIQTWIQTAE